MATKSNLSSRDSPKQAVLIVNPAEFRENFFQCQICVCNYNKSDRRPKTLTCGHIFCLSCLKQIFDKVPGNVRNALKCPTCRSETLITKDIKDLTPAFHTEQMMEVMATTKTLNLCSKHQGQALNFYCLKCSVPVCRDCTVVDHNRSDNHSVTDLSRVLADRFDEFKKIKLESEKVNNKLESRSRRLENALENLNKIMKDELNKVNNKFDEIIAFVRERKNKLEDEIINAKERLRNEMKTKNDHIMKRMTQFRCDYDNFCAARNSKDVNHILAMNEKMEARKEKFRKEADEDDTKLFQSFCVSFDSEELMSSLTGFGEILVYEDPKIKDIDYRWIRRIPSQERKTDPAPRNKTVSRAEVWHHGHMKLSKRKREPRYSFSESDSD